MKRVSFSVAKALKEAGYPQKYGEGTMCYAEDGTYFEHDSSIEEYYPDIFCISPTYLEVWLWLWREKREYLEIEHEGYPHTGVCLTNYVDAPFYDPEEAIEKAIEYLVNNNLIK